VNLLKLSLNLGEEWFDRYRLALCRVRDVKLVDDESRADAVITDSDVSLTNGPILKIPGHAGIPAMPWRYRPSIQEMKQRLNAGNLGEPGLLRVHRWKSDANLLADLDLAMWLFSAEPKAVYTLGRPGYLQVHLGFACGGMALMIHATKLAGCVYESVSLIGSRGAVYADDHRNVNLQLTENGCAGIIVREDETALVSMLTDFVGAIREQRLFLCDKEDYDRAGKVRERVMQSVAEEVEI